MKMSPLHRMQDAQTVSNMPTENKGKTNSLEVATLQHLLWNKWKSSSDKDELSTDVNQVERWRGLGDASFCANSFHLAAKCYHKAAGILLNKSVLETNNESHDYDELVVNILSQQSECLLRLKKWIQAAQVAEMALSIDPTHKPSLYRHAMGNWRGHIPSSKLQGDFTHVVFWASASQSFDKMKVANNSNGDDDNDECDTCARGNDISTIRQKLESLLIDGKNDAAIQRQTAAHEVHDPSSLFTNASIENDDAPVKAESTRLPFKKRAMKDMQVPLQEESESESTTRSNWQLYESDSTLPTANKSPDKTSRAATTRTAVQDEVVKMYYESLRT